MVDLGALVLVLGPLGYVVLACSSCTYRSVAHTSVQSGTYVAKISAMQASHKCAVPLGVLLLPRRETPGGRSCDCAWERTTGIDPGRPEGIVDRPPD